MLFRSPLLNTCSGALQFVVIGKNLFGAGYVAGSAFQFEGVGTEVNIDVQAVFQHVQVLIPGAEQAFRCWG